MDEVGVVSGRFQVLHIGHIEYLLSGKSKCKYLIVGVTNPDESLTAFSPENPHRSSPFANPLTYYERIRMIEGAMLEKGISRKEFDIVPFPINFPNLIFNYVPKKAKHYMTIYDDWGHEKKRILESLSCLVIITDEKKIASSSKIRNLIASNEPWKHLVPEYVYKYIIEHSIDLRTQILYEEIFGSLRPL